MTYCIELSLKVDIADDKLQLKPFYLNIPEAEQIIVVIIVLIVNICIFLSTLALGVSF